MHLLLIGVVALLLFGNRLPDVARALGRSFNEFKRGLKEVGDDDTDPKSSDPPAENPKLSNTAARGEPPPREHEYAGTRDADRRD